MMAGANPAAVQRILRHSDPRITTEVYGHLAPGYLRAEVDRLVFGLPAPNMPAVIELPGTSAVGADLGAFATRLLPEATDSKNEGRSPSGFPSESAALRWSGRQDLNLRPLAPQGPPPDFHGVAPVSTECHPAEVTEVCRTGSFHTEAPNAYKDTPFGAPVARLTRVQWLTPGEVAARLQVCRATVYKLCDAGQLGYARVGLSIRISEQQLGAFLSGNDPGQRP